MSLSLTYLSEFQCYGIKKNEVADMAAKEGVPEIILTEEICKKIAPQYHKKAKIGFLLGEDTSADGTSYYTIGNDYLKSLLKAGADLRFLDYDNTYPQVSQCDGLVLPGGAFNSPQEFYITPSHNNDSSKRSFAYIQATMGAEAKNKPLLGICAGAQMIGGMHGHKMYLSVAKETGSHISHKSSQNHAHEVFIKENSPLHKIMQTDTLTFWVNSRHNEAMIEQEIQEYLNKTDLEVYAFSKNDNIPEAWGNEKKNILCIQWHPENLAVQGVQSMQNIYNWIVDKSVSNKAKQKIKIPLPNVHQR